MNEVILVLVLILSRWTQRDAGSSCGRPSRRRLAGLGARRWPARSHRGHVVIHADRWDWDCCAFMLNRCYLVNCECPAAAARSSGSRQLDSFFMRLETRAALIHDGCKSASVSRGRITERPHVFVSWRLTSAMIPSPFIQPQSRTWSCGNIAVVLFQSDRMKWFDLDIF